MWSFLGDLDFLDLRETETSVTAVGFPKHLGSVCETSRF